MIFKNFARFWRGWKAEILLSLYNFLEVSPVNSKAPREGFQRIPKPPIGDSTDSWSFPIRDSLDSQSPLFDIPAIPKAPYYGFSGLPIPHTRYSNNSQRPLPRIPRIPKTASEGFLRLRVPYYGFLGFTDAIARDSHDSRSLLLGIPWILGAPTNDSEDSQTRLLGFSRIPGTPWGFLGFPKHTFRFTRFS